MFSLEEKLKEILEISEKLFEILKNGYPLPETERFNEYTSLMEERGQTIEQLKNCDEKRNISVETALLRKIEKTETEMMTLLKNESEELKRDIDTLNKGKKAVKNGYLNTYGKYTAKNRFSKRG